MKAQMGADERRLESDMPFLPLTQNALASALTDM